MAPVLRLTVSLAFVAFGAIGLAAWQQTAGSQITPPPGTGFILGKAVDGTTGRPLSGAVVSLSSVAQVVAAPGVVATGAPPATLSRFPIRVVTDGNGAFVFRELAGGSYSMFATRAGYASSAVGRSSASDSSSQLITLGDGEKRGGVTLRFWKYGAISGTVRDEAGEPVIGISLRIFRRGLAGGRVRLTSFGNMPTTDDRGMYRSAELAPGDYVVGVITTQAAVPVSIHEALDASVKDGSGNEFRRQLDRSGSTILGGLSLATGGRRVGSWLLQGSTDFGTATVMNPPGSDDRLFVYPATFYPSAHAISNATVLTVGAGEERTGTDFHLKPVPSVRVSGRLVGGDGEEANTALSLVPAAAADAQRDYDLATATTFADATGAFTFLGVPQGEYTIRVLKVPPRPVITGSTMTTVIQTGSGGMISSSTGVGPTPPPPIPPEPTWWARVPVTVADREVTGLTVTLQRGARLSGRIEFEGAGERPTGDRMRTVSVTIEQADGRTSSTSQFTLQRGVVDAAGQFKTYQLPAGQYVIRAAGVAGWTMKSATVNGRDAADTPFDLNDDDVSNIVVTFTDRISELSGTARSAKGPDETGTVFLFPADPSLWTDTGPAPRRFRTARAGTDGKFRFPSLVPGDYYAVATAGGAPADWQDPRFLQRLAAVASRITIAEGEKKSFDVEMKEVRR